MPENFGQRGIITTTERSGHAAGLHIHSIHIQASMQAAWWISSYHHRVLKSS